ncbi:MAG: hypothetical protein A2W28_01125 [Gammaproteobacteria bacterium RBG_16_51_14]|nr:MAG: hypothetical protein A2W28_01125 [Gammaproteobacteria bacterium RBG_16_51_14]
MSTSAPKKLTIEHLRGSVLPFSLPFEKGKKLMVIYGENGTGKSTICDAFEFLAKGNVGSLDNRGLGKTNRYWHSLGKKPADVSVTLETATATCRATVGKSEVIVNPPEHRPRIEVLRRSQILSLIEAKPAERYAAISRFIDVSGVEASEAFLRELIRDTKSGREVAIARVQENRDAIQQFWEEAGKPGVDPLLWGESESKRDASAFDSEIKAISNLYDAYARLADYPEQTGSAIKNLQEAQNSLDSAQQTIDKYLAGVSADAAEIANILESAKAYLSKHTEPSVCPLCESAEKAHGLTDRVNERIAAFDALHEANANKIKKEQGVHLATQQLEILEKNALQHTVSFNLCCTSNSWPADILLPGTPVPEDIAEWSAWLTSNAHLSAEWKKAETARQDKKQFLSTLGRAIKTCTENTLAQKELDTLLPNLEKALKIAEEERRQFTDATLAGIATEVGRLYEVVHPGEGFNKISLELDPAKRASLEIGASFCGQATPPQAYFSDSHLDTLGLCVFLALTALEKPAETILVLDDVLASVDEPHVERLIKMLYDEAVKFRHCVITTHYRPWKQKLRWGWLQNDQCQFVELTKWTAVNGLTLVRSVPDVERLRLLLAETPPDPQLVCSKAGVILEAALDFLTQLYECSIPRRAGGLYTLGDLLPALDKKLRTSLKVDVLNGADTSGTPVYNTVPLAPYMDELTRIAQARNVFGCHFNELSFDLLDADGLVFGQQVLELMSTLTDGDAGWPRNSKSGSYWATTGETRRLHPLKKPN